MFKYLGFFALLAVAFGAANPGPAPAPAPAPAPVAGPSPQFIASYGSYPYAYSGAYPYAAGYYPGVYY